MKATYIDLTDEQIIEIYKMFKKSPKEAIVIPQTTDHGVSGYKLMTLKLPEDGVANNKVNGVE